MVFFCSYLSFLKVLDLMRDYTPHVFFGFILIGAAVCISRGLIRLGFRLLVSLLMIVSGLILAPRISSFIVSRAGLTDVAERVISNIVEEDIEEKVKREYNMMASGTDAEIEDPALLEKLKSEAYVIDPALTDEENIFVNMGFPAYKYDSLPNNLNGFGNNDISKSATSFPDFVAKFFVSRFIIFISYVLAFYIANKAFRPRHEYLQ